MPGFLIDTNAGKLRLPGEKLNRLCHLIREWLQKKRCTKREFLSIAGQLQVNCNMQHHIKLNAGARSDLAWWHEFLEDWNGLSLLAALGGAEAHSGSYIRCAKKLGLWSFLEY